jgi:hypothetical protein
MRLLFLHSPTRNSSRDNSPSYISMVFFEGKSTFDGIQMTNPIPSPHFVPRPELSELARKYTHPRGGPHEVLQGLQVLKSGLTPVDFVPYQTVEEYIIAFALRAYQTARFSGLEPLSLSPTRKLTRPIGFTTLHLRTVDAFAPAINYPADLTLDGLPIHPMYAKENWSKAPVLKHSPKLPIGDGTKGYFDVRTGAPKILEEEILRWPITGEKSNYLERDASWHSTRISAIDSSTYIPMVSFQFARTFEDQGRVQDTKLSRYDALFLGTKK